jgi:ankyrin repeat protein
MSPTPEQIKDFVIAGHGNLPKVQAMLAETPALLNVAQAWSGTDHETAIQAAAHVGARPVAEFLLAHGAPLAIPTAAMLGRIEAVQQLLAEQPGRVKEAGAHGIPLLPHAALSGIVELIALLHGCGATEGASYALGNAVTSGHLEAARWLLANAHPNLSWQNYQGKTPLALAKESGNAAMVELLEGAGK